MLIISNSAYTFVNKFFIKLSLITPFEYAICFLSWLVHSYWYQLDISLTRYIPIIFAYLPITPLDSLE